MLAGIKDILLISTPRDIPMFKSLLGDGNKFGISISYETQDEPNGIAEALIIGEKFLDGERCALILGDNVLYGPGLGRDLINQIGNTGATILAHHVSNPKDFGVIEFDSNDDPVRIIEKPQNSESNWAIPGLYFYDEFASKRAKNLKPSSRGEREISDLNSDYLSEGKLKVIKMQNIKSSIQ